MKISVSKHINAPIHVTFAIFSDIAALPQHVDGIQAVEILSDVTEGQGTCWRETRVMFGQQATEEMEISTFHPNQGYEVLASSHGMDYHSTYTFVERDGGTLVQMDFAGAPKTLVAKLMSPLGALMSGSTKQALEADMDNLKAVCEARVAEG